MTQIASASIKPDQTDSFAVLMHCCRMSFSKTWIYGKQNEIRGNCIPFLVSPKVYTTSVVNGWFQYLITLLSPHHMNKKSKPDQTKYLILQRTFSIFQFYSHFLVNLSLVSTIRLSFYLLRLMYTKNCHSKQTDCSTKNFLFSLFHLL